MGCKKTLQNPFKPSPPPQVCNPERMGRGDPFINPRGFSHGETHHGVSLGTIGWWHPGNIWKSSKLGFLGGHKGPWLHIDMI